MMTNKYQVPYVNLKKLKTSQSAPWEFTTALPRCPAAEFENCKGSITS